MADNVTPNKGNEFKAFITNRKTFDNYQAYSSSGLLPKSVFSYGNNSGDLGAQLKQFGKEYTQTFDANGDGAISEEEFKASEASDFAKMFPEQYLSASKKKEMNDLSGKIFKEFDTDGDNKLNEQEMTAYVAMLDAKDGKLDGNISYSSFADVSEATADPNSGFKGILSKFRGALFGTQ